MKLNSPIRRRAGFHPRRGFHRRRRFIPPDRVDLAEKAEIVSQSQPFLALHTLIDTMEALI